MRQGRLPDRWRGAPWAPHLAGAALGHHEAVLADGTGLLRVGQRRAGVCGGGRAAGGARPRGIVPMGKFRLGRHACRAGPRRGAARGAAARQPAARSALACRRWGRPPAPRASQARPRWPEAAVDTATRQLPGEARAPRTRGLERLMVLLARHGAALAAWLGCLVVGLGALSKADSGAKRVQQRTGRRGRQETWSRGSSRGAGGIQSPEGPIWAAGRRDARIHKTNDFVCVSDRHGRRRRCARPPAQPTPNTSPPSLRASGPIPCALRASG